MSVGSPPRMRGKAEKPHRAYIFWGITPAYAGKSTTPRSQAPTLRDHPRVCGEKESNGVASWRRLGSPPRMRGKVFNGEGVMLATRITPAYAGKSTKREKLHAKARDHPRVCGEKRLRTSFCFSDAGSPPRMRGKALPLPLSGAALGITPAYAGKSSKRGSNSQWLRDHPRVCGEKCHVPALRRCEPGSPPRMRGKGTQYSLPVWRHRITPAYAGKSLPSRACPPSCWDHPRVCGEKVTGTSTVRGSPGSPPRMRGKAKLRRRMTVKERITPAYAGKRTS